MEEPLTQLPPHVGCSHKHAGPVFPRPTALPPGTHGGLLLVVQHLLLTRHAGKAPSFMASPYSRPSPPCPSLTLAVSLLTAQAPDAPWLAFKALPKQPPRASPPCPSLTLTVIPAPAQAPDPLWLAQRLVGGGLAAKLRPEYSYGRQFRGRSMDSATARLADSLDAVVRVPATRRQAVQASCTA